MRWSFTRLLGMCGILPPMRARTALLLAGLAAIVFAGAWFVAGHVRDRPSTPAAATVPQPSPSPAPPSTAAAALSQRDYDRVRAAVERGDLVPLEGVLADAQRRHAGTVLEVELEGGRYEVEILGEDGVIRELEYDSRTGELLDIEIEDD